MFGTVFWGWILIFKLYIDNIDILDCTLALIDYDKTNEHKYLNDRRLCRSNGQLGIVNPFVMPSWLKTTSIKNNIFGQCFRR